MKKNLKKYTLLILSFSILFNLHVLANSTLTSKQESEINAYTTELDLIQKNIYTLAQTTVFSNTNDLSIFQNTLSRLEKSLDIISDNISSSLDNLTHDTVFYRDLLLLTNAVNYIKASLYELNLITTQSSSSEKLTTLQRFFNFRVYANNSLRFLNSLQSDK
ncbi:hypothetical protein PBV87_00785 [Niameybacter massiliensis]|uniref:Uncharacterized protein n=1 Tax=Holtiella tumoricola TaxID=3018743 RepID=A0AA42DJY0_9FIRM|nr:hypothetical protein [Holtiella tumoricola]MDA3730048.1 hypothetical protein [Holtiella tumoricola]